MRVAFGHKAIKIAVLYVVFKGVVGRASVRATDALLGVARVYESWAVTQVHKGAHGQLKIHEP